jgi:hypothetical protein
MVLVPPEPFLEPAEATPPRGGWPRLALRVGTAVFSFRGRRDSAQGLQKQCGGRLGRIGSSFSYAAAHDGLAGVSDDFNAACPLQAATFLLPLGYGEKGLYNPHPPGSRLYLLSRHPRQARHLSRGRARL